MRGQKHQKVGQAAFAAVLLLLASAHSQARTCGAGLVDQELELRCLPGAYAAYIKNKNPNDCADTSTLRCNYQPYLYAGGEPSRAFDLKADTFYYYHNNESQTVRVGCAVGPGVDVNRIRVTSRSNGNGSSIGASEPIPLGGGRSSELSALSSRVSNFHKKQISNTEVEYDFENTGYIKWIGIEGDTVSCGSGHCFSMNEIKIIHVMCVVDPGPTPPPISESGGDRLGTQYTFDGNSYDSSGAGGNQASSYNDDTGPLSKNTGFLDAASLPPELLEQVKSQQNKASQKAADPAPLSQVTTFPTEGALSQSMAVPKAAPLVAAPSPARATTTGAFAGAASAGSSGAASIANSAGAIQAPPFQGTSTEGSGELSNASYEATRSAGTSLGKAGASSPGASSSFAGYGSSSSGDAMPSAPGSIARPAQPAASNPIVSRSMGSPASDLTSPPKMEGVTEILAVSGNIYRNEVHTAPAVQLLRRSPAADGSQELDKILDKMTPHQQNAGIASSEENLFSLVHWQYRKRSR